MDAVTPKCPSCSAPVQPDWDWCQLCGYDPESLMPAGWISPTLYQAEAAGGGTTTATKRRRAKRGRKTEAEATPPPPLIQLPENLVSAVDPITDERARPASPPPVMPAPVPNGFDPTPGPEATSDAGPDTAPGPSVGEVATATAIATPRPPRRSPAPTQARPPPTG